MRLRSNIQWNEDVAAAAAVCRWSLHIKAWAIERDGAVFTAVVRHGGRYSRCHVVTANPACVDEGTAKLHAVPRLAERRGHQCALARMLKELQGSS